MSNNQPINIHGCINFIGTRSYGSLLKTILNILWRKLQKSKVRSPYLKNLKYSTQFKIFFFIYNTL